MPDDTAPDLAHEYWRRSSNYFTIPLAIWCTDSFGVGILSVNEFNAFTVGHAPLGFWRPRRGILHAVAALNSAYDWLVNRLDAEGNND